MDDAGADLGLYLPVVNATNSNADFADSEMMIDFTQWGSSGNGRESVAVTKGIWSAGDFVFRSDFYNYIGDGEQNGVEFWVGRQLFDCHVLNLDIGDSCNDGNANTTNDIVQEDCSCAGEVPFDCPELGQNIGESCDDGNSDTTNDLVLFDCKCGGQIVIDCPELDSNIGGTCNDGNPDTVNDHVDENCNCKGEQIDCQGIVSGTAVPGTPCNDGNYNTMNDVYDDNCNCRGINPDCDCEGMEIITVCQNGQTKRVNCNAISDPQMYCGPCADDPVVCSECEYNEDGTITICWIPIGKDNFRTLTGDCEFLKNFFDQDGNMVRENKCGPCNCALIDDVDTDGDGICDRKDDCPNNSEKDIAGPCGCDDQDSDDDGVCDADDCEPNNPNLPTTPGSTCNDGSAETENDVITEDGCGCAGTIKECSIKLTVSDILCDDNGTPAIGADDTYSFSITAEANENAGEQWQGGFDNGFLGAFLLEPKNYGEKVNLGPFPAGTFTSTNTNTPVTVTNGLDIQVNINMLGDFSCIDRQVVQSPGPCACDDSDGDGVCDDEDICEDYNDNLDSDNDGIPDGCDECPDNTEKTEKGECGCDECPVDEDPCVNFCQPRGNYDYEWIDKISMNQLEITTGPNQGYLDFRNISLKLAHGDSLDLWVFPGYMENICELSIHIYVDWNGDCDFEDEGELLLWKRTLNETGITLTVPDYAVEGDITIRFMLHYGRILFPCQECIGGEIEDYTLQILSKDVSKSFVRNGKQNKQNIGQPTLRIFPNPVIDNASFLLDHDLDSSNPVNVNIYSLDGTLVYELELDNDQSAFSTDYLPAGVYIFELQSGKFIIRETMIVQK